MQRKEWYVVGYGVDLGGTGELVHYTYERAKAAAGKYPVRRLVLDESWVEPEEPEEEWVTPTDEDARTRPMVEVRQNEDDSWLPAILLAVRHIHPGTKRYIAIEKGTYSLYWSQCRIHKDEVELIYCSGRSKR